MFSPLLVTVGYQEPRFFTHIMHIKYQDLESYDGRRNNKEDWYDDDTK
jgi:hypothetical protein